MQNELQQAKEALHSISSKITLALHHLENLTKHAREFDENNEAKQPDVQQSDVETNTPESENPQESTTTTDPSTDTTVTTA